MNIKVVWAGVVGIFTGFLTVQAFPHSWLDLFLWALVGIMFGFFTVSKEEVVWSGLAYGSQVTLGFLFSGFHGDHIQIVNFLFLSFFLAVAGGCFGFVLTFTGNLIRRQF